MLTKRNFIGTSAQLSTSSTPPKRGIRHQKLTYIVWRHHRLGHHTSLHLPFFRPVFSLPPSSDNEQEDNAPSPAQEVPSLPLESWDGEQASEPPSTQRFIDWGSSGVGDKQPGRLLGNAIFFAAVGCAAMLAFVVQRQHTAYNRHRAADAKLSSVAVAVGLLHKNSQLENIKHRELTFSTASAVSDAETNDDGGEEEGHQHGHGPDTVSQQQQQQQQQEQLLKDNAPHNSLHTPSTDATFDSTPLPRAAGGSDATDIEAAAAAAASASKDGTGSGSGATTSVGDVSSSQPQEITRQQQQQQQQQQGEEFPRLPLRTPQGEAAMERIRQVQARRRQLYQRALDRSEAQAAIQQNNHQKYEEEAEQQGRRRVEKPLLGVSVGQHQCREEEQQPLWQRYDSRNDVASLDAEAIREAARRMEVDQQSSSHEVGVLEIPQGMSLTALKERANSAHKAASSAAKAAHRAMGAAAMAAEAADKAVHEAQSAALAADRCQSALELRSADAVEAAVRAAEEAEGAAVAASQHASVGAAKALLSEHDASKSADKATEASDLSAPRSILEKVSGAVRSARRNVVGGVKTFKENAGAASEFVVVQGKGVVSGVQQGVSGAWQALSSKLKW